MQLVKNLFKVLLLFVSSSLTFQSCVGLKVKNKAIAIKKESTSTNNLLVGATLNYHELNTIKKELFLKDFKYLTPANAAKQSRIHPKPNVWRWKQIDDFINLSKKRFYNEKIKHSNIHSMLIAIAQLCKS